MVCGLWLAAGCAMVAPLPSFDLSEQGWILQQGQAIWRPGRDASELAGDLILAHHPNGRSLVQFAKTPLTLVIAQRSFDQWEIRFPAQSRTFSGRGNPPRRFIWFFLPDFLSGGPLPYPWIGHRSKEPIWTINNLQTGETLKGYFQTGISTGEFRLANINLTSGRQ